jgi:DNA-binding MarR family transcriptional regulator
VTLTARLPARVLAHLTTHGRDFTTNIAQALDQRSSAIAGAITSLRARGLVVRDGEEPAPEGGHSRVYYRATADAGALVPASLTTPAPAVAPVELLARLDDELKVLHLEHAHAGVDPVIEELIYRNGPVPGGL